MPLYNYLIVKKICKNYNYPKGNQKPIKYNKILIADSISATNGNGGAPRLRHIVGEIGLRTIAAGHSTYA